MAMLKKETCISTTSYLLAIHYNRGKFYFGDRNFLCIVDEKTFEQEKIEIYPSVTGILKITTSLDGLFVYLVLTTTAVISVDLRTNHVVTVLPPAILNYPRSVTAGNAGEIFIFTCNTTTHENVVTRHKSDTGFLIETLPGELLYAYGLLYFAGVGKLVAINSELYMVKWDIENGICSVSDKCISGSVTNIIGVNDTMIAVGRSHDTNDYQLQIWNIVTMKEVSVFQLSWYAFVHSRLLAVLEQRYVVAITSNELCVFDITTGEKTQPSIECRSTSLCAAVSSDGFTVAQLMPDNKIVISVYNVGLIPALLCDDVEDDGKIITMSLHARKGFLRIGHNDRYDFTPATKAAKCIEHPHMFTLSNVHRRRNQQCSNWSKIVFLSKIATQWVEALNTVLSVKALPQDEQALRTNANIINWHKLDLFQMINHRQQHRGIFGLAIPIDIVHLIGQYVIN